MQFYRLPLLFLALWLLPTSLVADDVHKQLITSCDFNYQFVLHINKRTLHVDKAPDNLYFSEYMLSISQPYEYKVAPVITSDYNPFNAPSLFKKSAQRGHRLSMSLRKLKDGIYNVILWGKRPSDKKFTAHTELYHIPIEVKDRQITFVESPYLAHNRAVLDTIPRDRRFLAKCILPTAAAPSQSPYFKKLARQLTMSSSGPRATVARVSDWIANHLYHDFSSVSYIRKDLNAQTIIEGRKTVEYGFALVGLTLLRAAQIPTAILPINQLRWNSPYWIADSAVATQRRHILIAFYEDTWHVIDPYKNAKGQYNRNRYTSEKECLVAHRGVDMSIPYLSNRVELLYEGGIKYLAESHRHPIDINPQILATMSVDSVDQLPKETQLYTSYCRPYTLGLQVQDSVVCLTTLPREDNLTTWQAELRNPQGKPLCVKSGSLYDTAQMTVTDLPSGHCYFNLYDKDNEYYVGNKCIPIDFKEKSASLLPADDLDWNRSILDSLRMTPALKEELLRSTILYPAQDTTVVQLAHEITAGLTDDYLKLAAIYRWVSTHIHYDKDKYYAGTYSIKANLVHKVLKSKRGVCSGYTFVACAFMRAVGIPALGLPCITRREKGPVIKGRRHNSRHIFPIAYCAGRWVMMDPTWDSKKIYLGETYRTIQNTQSNMVYFDATMAFMSHSRRFIMPRLETFEIDKWEEYVKRNREMRKKMTSHKSVRRAHLKKKVIRRRYRRVVKKTNT